MKSSKCKTLKSPRRKRQTVSGTSIIKWERHDDEGGRWHNDYGSVSYTLFPTRNYKIYIYRSKKPDCNPREWNWTLRDMTYSRNIVLPGMDAQYKSLKECKRRSILAYMLVIVLRLLKKNKHPDALKHDGRVLYV